MRVKSNWKQRRLLQQKQGPKGHKFKSGLEKLFALRILQSGLSAQYEPDRFPFVKKAHYTPDFKIKDKTYIETKGYFAPSDRSKFLSFKEQYPDITVYLVFGNAKNKLNKNSKTTYGEWATRHDITWTDISSGIPKEWWN